MLLDIARNQSDVRLRLTAIKRLGEQSGDNIPDELAKIYDADNSKEVRTQILRAFSELPSTRGESKLLDIARGSSDIELRQYAIRFLGERHEESSLNALISLFDSNRTPQIR